jgi:hypothetical protein
LIRFFLRIEHEHGQGGFVHVQLADQPLVGLPAEVP